MRGSGPVMAAVLLLIVAAPTRGHDDVIFYDDFETGDSSGWWAPARVAETGQTTCYDLYPSIPCAGTGQDGDLRGGVAWPNPRFTDNGDGTVTDNLTALIWLKDANCFGGRIWTQALSDANGLASGSCGLSDGSAAGDWRLPTINELQSLIHHEYHSPALPDTAGTGQWTEGDPFTDVQNGSYWASTSLAFDPSNAWYAAITTGIRNFYIKTNPFYVWPVRGVL